MVDLSVPCFVLMCWCLFKGCLIVEFVLDVDLVVVVGIFVGGFIAFGVVLWSFVLMCLVVCAVVWVCLGFGISGRDLLD